VELNVPGREWFDDLTTLSASALSGGFTTLAGLPFTQPPIDTPELLTWLLRQAQPLPVELQVWAPLTTGTRAERMPEFMGLVQAGALGFTDTPLVLHHTGTLMRAFQYLGLMPRPVWLVPYDTTISPQGSAPESPFTTRLGLPTVPVLAETLALDRILEVAHYTGYSVHIGPITTEAGVERIRRARERGITLTASTAPAYLYFEDTDLATFDTNLKVLPTLRTASDVAALRQAVADGTLDFVASHHSPQPVEHKAVEFDLATPGMLALEVSFAVQYTTLVRTGLLSLSELLHRLTYTTRQVLGLAPPVIAPQMPDTLTYIAEEEWQVTASDFQSRSRNAPWVGRTFSARVVQPDVQS
jgi:dihydroorotase